MVLLASQQTRAVQEAESPSVALLSLVTSPMPPVMVLLATAPGLQWTKLRLASLECPRPTLKLPQRLSVWPHLIEMTVADPSPPLLAAVRKQVPQTAALRWQGHPRARPSFEEPKMSSEAEPASVRSVAALARAAGGA